MRHPYADFIDEVAKPARYLGGEYLAVAKNRREVDARIVLAFPDVYEIGMSHLGTKILYSLLNRHPRIAAERAFTPWGDMEAQLRRRRLPLVSLETSTPLCDFDVVGVSLQYELTFTNVLTLLDLGGVPLRAADRGPGDALVIGGGPTASHPEPMAPFFDAFFIGEAEEALPEMLLELAAMRRQGRPRLDLLAQLASRFPLYVPALYDTATDEATGMVIVGEPRDGRVPARVRRAVVADLDNYPFPADSPVPYAEAVFDRAAVEIARGCTEGCRFCQAGMIYRPVRERSPESIVATIVQSVERGGYDETSLTSLSTADFSCVTPLVKAVAAQLRRRNVSLSVSSLRAYGLGEEILDEMASMRITGLTFAPEAGTQRMRDVVNKNVSEAHVEQSAHRVFSRGWNRLKLYFMIGLPTEEDSDVLGIIETGERMLDVGRTYAGKRAEVTVSVSSHVPKPHTPFQWCAQDSPAEIARKQALLRGSVRRRGLRLKVHHGGISFVEGVLSRGDRRLADAIELAWRRGARFDGWDELFDLERWNDAFAATGIDAAAYLATRPTTARLPWDHIDVGLEDGFLVTEYRKALGNRLSQPCGKVAGQLLHPARLADAVADRRKLVCYDCGVACDLATMRARRIEHLAGLEARAQRAATAPPPVARPRRPSQGGDRHHRYRLRYAKLGRAALLGHLDSARLLARILRRAAIPVAQSRGFHPKPVLQFAPALALGVPSLGEYVEVALTCELDADELLERLRQVAPEGMAFTGAWSVPLGAPRLSALLGTCDFLVLPRSADATASGLRTLADGFCAAERREVLRGDRVIDVRSLVESVEVLEGAPARRLCAALDWPAAQALLRAEVRCGASGSAKPRELAEALAPGASAALRPLVARLGFRGVDGALQASAALASALGGTTLRGGDRSVAEAQNP